MLENRIALGTMKKTGLSGENKTVEVCKCGLNNYIY